VTPALQAIAAALSLEKGVLPPTVNSEARDARCPINLVKGETLKHESKFILSNAIGFGGFYYASSVFAISEK
jgi:3-oxoacyl-(acyl-carrier-protein) synthase